MNAALAAQHSTTATRVAPARGSGCAHARAQSPPNCKPHAPTTLPRARSRVRNDPASARRRWPKRTARPRPTPLHLCAHIYSDGEARVLSCTGLRRAMCSMKSPNACRILHVAIAASPCRDSCGMRLGHAAIAASNWQGWTFMAMDHTRTRVIGYYLDCTPHG